ncbi:MAG TPA: sigma-70 family RNA polymerase sigma factor [Chloroflexota bacterium]|jgi:RNA polymerase sigma-70 factor (ECF subfamily)|nr:sigma-70 family RNA polymerase sigma factor [Chloroflexota bacterium]
MADALAGIVARAQQGDGDAIRELIVSQQTYVYSICRGIMHNDADAADTTQDAFMRLLKSLHTYRGETKFTTWLYRLVTNVCLDELRRRGHPIGSLDLTEGDAAPYEPPDPDPWSQPEQWIDAAETASELQGALAQLSTAQRLSLTLFYFDDMRYEDIAQVLDVPLNTVKSHIRRAKDRLADILRGRQLELACSATT